MRRKKDWEGGNMTQASHASSGPILQRYSNRRIMHCSLCGDSSHRKMHCPTKNTTEATKNVESGQLLRASQKESDSVKKKSNKELKRQNLEVKRPVKKAGQQEMENNQDEEHQENIAEKELETVEDNEQQTSIKEGENPGSAANFTYKAPRRKLPVLLEDEDAWERSGQDYASFQEKLRGPTGFKAVFMPTPGLSPFLPPRGTPPALTPPVHEDTFEVGQAPSTQQSTNSVGLTRRATRSSTKFKNIEADPVHLGI